MSATLESARALLKKGKTKIIDQERSSLSELIAQAQLQVDTLKDREKSLLVLVEKDRAQVTSIRQELLELEECEDALEPGEYKQALDLFQKSISEITVGLSANEALLTSVRADLTIYQEQLSSLRERANLLAADPTGLCIPGLALPVADSTCNPLIAKYVESAAGEIRRLKRLVGAGDYKGAILVATTLAARVRKVSDDVDRAQGLSQFDALMVRQLLGAVRLVCSRMIPKDVNGLNTYIPCLRADWTPTTGWAQFISDTLAEQSKHHAVAEPVKPAVVVPEAEKEDTALMDAVVTTGLATKTKGKRIIFYGGFATKHSARHLTEWAMDALQMEVMWYDGEKPSGAARSIKSGGADLLVILAGFVLHKSVDFLKAEAPADFPIMLLHTMNVRVFTSTLARMCGIVDFEKELK